MHTEQRCVHPKTGSLKRLNAIGKSTVQHLKTATRTTTTKTKTTTSPCHTFYRFAININVK